MILVVSSEKDEHATRVLAELRGLGEDAVLLDLSAFPQQTSLTLGYGSAGNSGAVAGWEALLANGHGSPKALHRAKAAWWRRPQTFEPHPEIVDPDHRSFVFAESQEAFQGLWQALDVFWINHPRRDEQAHRKVHQLRLAQKLGLPIPETCITSDPQAARRFLDRRGPDNTIFKAFSATYRHWRETRLLRREELEALEKVRYAPVIFQEYIDAAYDLRVTVVGEEMFPSAIYSQETSYKVDFRMDFASARCEAAELPEATRRGLRQLMDELGLVYGAIDLRVRPDGEHVFLEINPAGQWLFLEQRTGQPITATLTRELASAG